MSDINLQIKVNKLDLCDFLPGETTICALSARIDWKLLLIINHDRGDKVDFVVFF